MTTLTAADIMARTESTFSPETDVYEALQSLLSQKLTGAPVVDADGGLLGMLTERDCLRVLVRGALDGVAGGPVHDHMTSPAVSIGPTTSVYEIVHLFLTRPYRKLPVVDEAGRVIGQVSRRDTLIALDSLRDQRLYGVGDVEAPDGDGVDSAMRIARGQR